MERRKPRQMTLAEMEELKGRFFEIHWPDYVTERDPCLGIARFDEFRFKEGQQNVVMVGGLIVGKNYSGEQWYDFGTLCKEDRDAIESGDNIELSERRYDIDVDFVETTSDMAVKYVENYIANVRKIIEEPKKRVMADSSMKMSGNEIKSLTGRYFKIIDSDGSDKKVMLVNRIEIDGVYVDAWGYIVYHDDIDTNGHVDFGVWTYKEDEAEYGEKYVDESKRHYRLREHIIEITADEAKAFVDDTVKGIYEGMKLA